MKNRSDLVEIVYRFDMHFDRMEQMSVINIGKIGENLFKENWKSSPFSKKKEIKPLAVL